MALQQLISFPIWNQTKLPSRSLIPSLVYSTSGNNRPLASCQVRSMVASKDGDHNVVRRSETFNYRNWDYDYIQSLKSEYVGEPYATQAAELKEELKSMLDKVSDPVKKLELISTVDRLGISYHFEKKVESLLKTIYSESHTDGKTKKYHDLYATALEFALLRKYGYNVSEEVFSQFMDDQGNYKTHLCGDLKGLLYLYEASFFAAEGDSTILDEAREFTKKILQEYVNQSNKNEYLHRLVSHSLEAPVDWRTPRLEARWFINQYKSKHDMEPVLLEFAKLDFNMLQAIHQDDLKYCIRSWRKTRLSESMRFFRDWLMSSFFGAAGSIGVEPGFGYCRRRVTRVVQFVFLVDDIYDLYGTLDELELFTDAIVRWDINAVDQLPYYMKLVFMALYNSVMELSYDILKDHGLHIMSYLRKSWADLSRAYLLEAKWYHAGYTPTLEEYLENAEISIATQMVLTHAYFCVINPLTTDDLQRFKEYADMIRWSAIIIRLIDDLGTAMGELKRGDVPKSIQCYMHQTGASEEEARAHMNSLISKTWKKIHKNRLENPHFSPDFVRSITNLTRLSQCYFSYSYEYLDLLPRANKMEELLFIEPI